MMMCKYEEFFFQILNFDQNMLLNIVSRSPNSIIWIDLYQATKHRT